MQWRFWTFWSVILVSASVWSGKLRLPQRAAIDKNFGPQGERAKRVTRYDAAVQAKIESLVDRLKSLTNDIHPQTLRCFGEPATPNQIDSLQSQLGFSLPGELKAFLLLHNGQTDDTPDLFGSWWRLLNTSEIVEAETWYGDIEYVELPLPNSDFFGPAFVPFAAGFQMETYLGIHLEDGAVYKQDISSNGYTRIAGSFSEWLENIVYRLEDKHFHSTDEEFIFRDAQGRRLELGQESY